MEQRSSGCYGKFARVASLLAVVSFTVQLVGGVHGGQFNEARVNDLLEKQAHFKDGIIRLYEESLQQFTAPELEPRPYSLIIFFDAMQLKSKAELKLELLREEYGLVAKAYVKINPDCSLTVPLCVGGRRDEVQ